MTLCLGGVTAYAGDSTLADKPSEWRGSYDNYVEEAPWEENSGRLPPPPEEKNLLAMSTVSIDSEHEYFIDRVSVSLADDKVFRYTVVVRSPTGASNVLYEGIRCETQEFKTYAYLSNGTFLPLYEQEWRRVSNRGATGYRAILVDEYVCLDSRRPSLLDAIETRLEKTDRDSRRQLKVIKRLPEDSKS